MGANNGRSLYIMTRALLNTIKIFWWLGIFFYLGLIFATNLKM
jgi:hypothetical protein